MPKHEVMMIWRGGALLGEGPVWSDAERALYFVDIKGRFVHRIKSETLEATSWSTPYPIGSIAPRSTGQWICAHQKGIALLDLSLRGKVNLTPMAAPEAGLPNNRFNDGRCDPFGRFWAGTMDDKEIAASGSLYRVDADHKVTRVDEGYRVTNGPAFSLDGRRAFVNDSALRVTYVFAMRDDGQLTDKTVWRTHAPEDGYPDGMTVDAEDCLWIAFWGGAKVMRFSPKGDALMTITLPVPHVTSCTFGGLNLDRLFITSAAIGLSADDRERYPLSGHVFSATPGVKGVPAHAFLG